MSDNSLDCVLITPSYESGEPCEKHYDGVDLLIVEDDELHVWFEGTHYIGQGTASTVEVGDVFLRTLPETVVERVISVDKSKPPSELGVEVEILYDVTLGSDETLRSQTRVNELTGQIKNPPMGDPGPPTLLREH